MTKQLIIDFETLGVDQQKCPIIDCSVMRFEWERFYSDNPYTIADIELVTKFKVSIEDQVKNYGYKIEQRSLNFWKEQDERVAALIAPSPGDLSLREFVAKLADYLAKEEIGFWWSRSNTFDPIILERIFRDFGRKDEMGRALSPFKIRDIRTFIDAKFDFSGKNNFCPISDTELWESAFEEHNSKWDVLADVLRIQRIIRAENSLD